MFVSEPFFRFESPAVVPVRPGLRSVVVVFAIALVMFMALLVATPGITRICPAPRAGTPVHLAR